MGYVPANLCKKEKPVPVNVNCTKADKFNYCTDPRVKRSLFGYGPRPCVVVDGGFCPYQEQYPRPAIPKLVKL